MSKHKFTLKQSARADDFDKKTPALRGMWKVIEDTINEGDRGAVLILTSFLEELTKRILLAFMIEGTKEKDFTDGGNAPLGTFSARIKTARALGLITEDERHDLDILRDLRNAFAHEVGANFAERSVRDQCRSLKLSADEPDALPRDNFTTAAFALMIELAERTSQITEKRCQPLLRSAKKWTRAEDEKAEAEFVAERKPKRHND